MAHDIREPDELQAALERSQALPVDQLELDQMPHLTQDGADAGLARLQHQVYVLAAVLETVTRELDDLRAWAGR